MCSCAQFYKDFSWALLVLEPQSVTTSQVVKNSITARNLRKEIGVPRSSTSRRLEVEKKQAGEYLAQKRLTYWLSGSRCWLRIPNFTPRSLVAPSSVCVIARFQVD